MIFLYTILTIVTTLLILFYLRYIGIQEENKLKEEKKEKALVKEIEEYKKIIDFEKTSIEFKEEIKKKNCAKQQLYVHLKPCIFLDS